MTLERLLLCIGCRSEFCGRAALSAPRYGVFTLTGFSPCGTASIFSTPAAEQYG